MGDWRSVVCGLDLGKIRGGVQGGGHWEDVLDGGFCLEGS